MENLSFDKVLLKNAKMLNLSETKTNQGDSAQNSLFVEVFEKSLLSIGFELTHQLKEVLLRFVFALKERDINSEDGIFGFKFSRPEQRILLEIVDNNNFILDMFKDEFEFKVLAKKIHSLTKKNSRKYPNQAKQFKMLLDNKKPENWNNKFNLILSSPDFITEEHLAEVLLERPTDFSRNIIVLLSKYNPDTIISLYSKVIKDVPFKALSELYSALITPEYEHNRIVLIKNKFKSIGDSEVVLSDKVKENKIFSKKG